MTNLHHGGPKACNTEHSITTVDQRIKILSLNWPTVSRTVKDKMVLMVLHYLASHSSANIRINIFIETVRTYWVKTAGQSLL